MGFGVAIVLRLPAGAAEWRSNASSVPSEDVVGVNWLRPVGAAEAGGTAMPAPQFGQVIVRPADRSVARSLAEQEGQAKAITMGYSQRRGAPNPALPKGPPQRGAEEQHPAGAPCGARPSAASSGYKGLAAQGCGFP